MKYVKKTVLGYQETSWNSNEATHVLISVDKYKQMLERHEKEVIQLKINWNSELERTKKASRVEKEQMMAEYKQKLQLCQESISNYVTQLEETNLKLQETKEKLTAQVDLNKNLLRIARERANSERNLVPKKQHPGYVLLSLEEWADSITIEFDYDDWRKKHPFTAKEDFIPRKTIALASWKSVIQTPYVTSFPFHEIKEQVLEDLAADSLKNHFGYDDVIMDMESVVSSSQNILYKCRFKALQKSNYWEVTVFTTKSLIMRD